MCTESNQCVTAYYDEAGCLIQPMFQGAKIVLSILCEVEASPDQYIPIDLTEQDAIEIIFKKRLSLQDRPIISKSLGNGIEIDPENNALMHITIDRDDTTACCFNLVGTLSLKLGDWREDIMNIRLLINPITNNL